MAIGGREWLLNHLDEQAKEIAAMTRAAREDPSDDSLLLRVRDQLFVMSETLGTLGVPLALSSRDDWRRAAERKSD